MERYTARLNLETLYALSDGGRIISTREPNPRRGPIFSLIRSCDDCAWAVNATVSDLIAAKLDQFALKERPIDDFQATPDNADRYAEIAGGRINAGPVFTFPDDLPAQSEVVPVTELEVLRTRFRGWRQDEIEERSPIVAVLEAGTAASLCFCARRSPVAAEAGLETAPEARRRGHARRAVTAWALAVKATGKLPIYSTSWSNKASLAVARSVGLIPIASWWSLI